MVEGIIEHSDNITFNWLLTQDVGSSYCESTIKRHQTGIGGKRIDYEDEITHRNMLEKIMGLIEKRVEDAKHIEALRTKDKQSDISMILETLGKKNGGYYG